MKILITIDVECDHGHGYDEMVFGRCSDGSVWGIEYIARTLFDHGLKGIFFVEPLESKRYGMGGLKEAVDTIISFGHEIQLHLHPSFEGGPDAMYRYRLQDQAALIRRGKNILKECGVDRICAFRAGSFSADLATLNALNQCEILFDSSYNLNYQNTNCRIPAEHFLNLPTWIEPVWEFPVTCFNWPFHRFGDRFRHLQITAAGLGETMDVFDDGLKLGYEFITILLHSFEFIVRGRSLIPDRKNIRRFEGLCRILQQQNHRMTSVGFLDVKVGDLKKTFKEGPRPIPRVRISSWVRRNLEQMAVRIRSKV